MTIKKLFFAIIATASTTPTLTTLSLRKSDNPRVFEPTSIDGNIITYGEKPQQQASFGNRIRSRLKEMVGKIPLQYKVCRIYDFETTTRAYRNVMAGKFVLLGMGFSGISYGGYRLIKYFHKTPHADQKK